MVEDMTFLLVERYDRVHRQTSGGGSTVERVHQEDFCQALGIVPETKYQKEGGPSLKDCFHLLREVSRTPVIDLARLLDAVIFNYLIGNNDAHGKNYSLLYPGAGMEDVQVRLAPLYDVVSTIYYPELSQEMAMKIGGEYSSAKVTPQNFEKLAEEAGLAKPLVRRRVPELADAILSTLPNVEMQNPTTASVAALIKKRAERTRTSFRS
jgi:serine/threonine-protein kinase HipA